MILILEGDKILSIQDFHQALAKYPKMPDFYGKNLDALWDAITGLIERPFSIKWKQSEISRQYMGSDFDTVIKVFQDAKMFDLNIPNYEEADRFTYTLE